MRLCDSLRDWLVGFTIAILHAIAPSPVIAAVDELVQTSGPGGGLVGDLLCAPDGDLFALSNGFLYRRAHRATSWARTAELNASGLATNTANALFAFAYRNGVSRSEDDGRTWERLEHAPVTVWDLVFVDADRGFAGTPTGVSVTHDRGDTWIRATGVPEVSVFALAAGSAGIVYAGAEHELWSSTDDGATWSLLGVLPNDITAIVERPEGGVYVGVASGYWRGAEPGGIYFVDASGVAFHAGLAWQSVSSLLVHQGDVYVAGAGICGEFVCWGPGVFRTLDGGANWDLVGAESTPVTSIAAAPDGALYAGTSSLFTDIGGYPPSGVLRSESPFTVWRPVNDNLPHSVVYSLAAGGRLVVAAADQGIFMTADRGVTWTPVTTRPHHQIHEQALSFELALSLPTIFALPPGGPLYVSHDFGQSWIARDAWIGGASVARRLVISAQGTLIMSVEDIPGLLRSTTQGQSWQRVAAFERSKRAIDLAAGSGPRLVVTAGRGFPSYEGQTYVSNDDGLTWTPIASIGGPVALAPDERTIYVAARSATYQLSEDDGWTPESLPHLGGVTDLVVAADGTVYAAAGGRAKRWRPGDSDWSDVQGPGCHDFFLGLHGLGFEERLVLDGDGFLYLGTTCAGVLRSDVSTPIRVRELHAATHSGAVRLTWSLISDAHVAHVQLQRGLQADGPYERIAVLTALEPSMSYEDRDVLPGEEYWYRLLMESRHGTTTVAGPLRVVVDARVTRTTLYLPVVSDASTSVQIRYAVGPVPAQVRVAIHDVRGRLIHALEEGVRSPGHYSRTWDRAASPVASGVYFVRLVAGNIEQSRKLLLVR